ncbi:MAG: nitroreductase family protein [Polyangia bacterium]|jgi:nitroreductase|nr:nitroreductase family protein [Polyangia bacterium]
MDIHETIRTRRSVRRFRPDPIPKEALERLLEAFRWAPSWVNLQPWELVVVDDPAVKERLAECVPATNPGRKAVSGAPLVLAVCGRAGRSGLHDGKPVTMHGDWVMFDLGIACQTLCLAAWAEGLGTLHLGWLDHAAAGAVLGLSDGTACYELIPIGVPEKPSRDPGRRALSELVHHNRFGAPWAR